MSSSAGDWTWRLEGGKAKIHFDWIATQRRLAVRIIPIVISALRFKAPVGDRQNHPDAGRFRDSIGFRYDIGYHNSLIRFVSTAPYARYVLDGTSYGAPILPGIGSPPTQALRWPDGAGGYSFSLGVIRGATPANHFNREVAISLTPFIKAALKDSAVIVMT